MDESRHVNSAGEVLGRLLDRGMISEGKRWWELFRRWEKIVGEKAAAHSQVVDVQKGRVIIETDHPGWAQILQTKSKTIIDAVNKLQPAAKVHGIRIRVGYKKGAGGDRDARAGDGETDGRAAPADQTPKEQAPAEHAPPPRHTEGDVISSIEDEELKKTLKGLGQAVRRRSESS
mgnify:CR=1 FL=1